MARGSILAIDQGTTSTRAIVFDGEGHIRAVAQRELPQNFPADGWVEHDPEEIWQATLAVCREVLAAAPDVTAIGIANQRETTVMWERATGKPIYNAIVWQDRRGADLCRRLEAEGQGAMVQRLTGLLLDPYFSATKIAWLLDNVPEAREARRGGRACRRHHRQLPPVAADGWARPRDRCHQRLAQPALRHPSPSLGRGAAGALRRPPPLAAGGARHRRRLRRDGRRRLRRPLPILALVGDQQAAGVGQACFEPGMIKSTYGTGCFVLVNSGAEAPLSRNRLVTTVGVRIAGRTTYALEGSIFVAGAAVQWLRDRLGFVAQSSDSEAHRRRASGQCRGLSRAGLHRPRGTLLGPEARGAIFGLTRDIGIAEIVRAALEAVCYQTRDLMQAMAADGAPRPKALRVDGGMSANDWLMQFLADILDLPVERPVVTETTALGAAYLAGLQAGIFTSTADIAQHWQRDRLFEPKMKAAAREGLYAGWLDAVARVRR